MLRSAPVQFHVFSRHGVESLRPLSVPHLFISIRTPGDPNEARLPVNHLTRGVLRLQFHDLDRVPKEPLPLIGVPPESWAAQFPATADTLFNERTARQVLDFVRAHLIQDQAFAARQRPEMAVQAIVVHCDAGLSRSPAVAAALTRGLFEQDDSHWFKTKAPNMLVYRRLLNATQESA
jgi:predicted protein tyrosine phosphatase